MPDFQAELSGFGLCLAPEKAQAECIPTVPWLPWLCRSSRSRGAPWPLEPGPLLGVPAPGPAVPSAGSGWRHRGSSWQEPLPASPRARMGPALGRLWLCPRFVSAVGRSPILCQGMRREHSTILYQGVGLCHHFVSGHGITPPFCVRLWGHSAILSQAMSYSIIFCVDRG